MLDMSDRIREMILQQRPGADIKRAAKEEGMTFLREAADVLEHLLEYHFELLFERMSALAQSSPCFALSFLRCWKLGQAERPENAARFDALQDLLMGKN